MALSPYLIDRKTYDGQQRMLVEMQHRDTPELVEPTWERRYPVTTAGAVQELHRRGLVCSDERFVEMARRTGLPTRVIGRSYVWFASDIDAVAEDLDAMGKLTRDAIWRRDTNVDARRQVLVEREIEMKRFTNLDRVATEANATISDIWNALGADLPDPLEWSEADIAEAIERTRALVARGAA